MEEYDNTYFILNISDDYGHRLFPSGFNTPQLAANIIHLGRLKIAGLEIRVIPRSLLRLGCSQSQIFSYGFAAYVTWCSIYREYNEFQAIFFICIFTL